MKHKEITEKFIDLSENKLGAAEEEQLLKEIASDPSLSKLWQQYQELTALEKDLEKTEHTLSLNFAVKVMEKVQVESNVFKIFFWRVVMKLKERTFIAGASAVFVVMMTFILVGEEDTQTKIEASFRQASQNADESSDLRPGIRPQPRSELQTSAAKSPIKIVEQEPEPKESALSIPRKAAGTGKTLASSQKLQNQARETALAQKKVVSSDAKPKATHPKDNVLSDELIFKPGRSSGMRHTSFRDMYLQPSESSPAYTYQPYPTAAPQQERYAEYEENPRIAVSDEAKSTFSIDVDTGSYTNIRRFLRLGQLPPKDSVRIEEMINYFDYNYPDQFEKPFSLSSEFRLSPLDKERYLLKIGIKAKNAAVQETPWNLVFLVDVSGSMAGPDKLGLVKQSLKLLAKQMRAEDKISLVTYAGNAGTLFAGKTAKEQADIISRIDQLGAGGGTNGSGGIREAYRVAQEHLIADGVNRIVLATDGDFNVGTTNQAELIELVAEKRKSGVSLTSIGFGTGNYNEAMMEQIANKGNGNYFYIDGYREARKVFEKDLFGTIEIVAKDVKLQIEFNPDYVSYYRLIGYDNRQLKKKDFGDDKVDAGEIGSAHTVTALYEIILNDSNLAKTQLSEYRYAQNRKEKAAEDAVTKAGELAFLKVRYKEPQGSTSELMSFPISNQLSSGSEGDFNFAAAVAYFGQLLRESQYAAGYSFSDVYELAKKSVGVDSENYRSEFLELVASARTLAE